MDWDIERRAFGANLRSAGLHEAIRVFVSNMRFILGIKIGGFTSAHRDWV